MAVVSGPNYVHHRRCVCGGRANVGVVVHWRDGDSRYYYCSQCAGEIICHMGGVELVETHSAAAQEAARIAETLYP